MSRTRVQTLTVTSALLLSLAACGTTGAGSTGSPTTPVPSPAPAPAVDLPAALRNVSDGAAGTGLSSLSSDLSSSGSAGGTMQDFLTSVLSDVDRYWTGVFTSAGLPEPHVSYAFPAKGEPLSMACGPDYQATDHTAAYCSTDDTIYFGETAATDLWQGTWRTNGDPGAAHQAGDFSVAYVMAHEYAHDLQAELGILGGSTVSYPVYKTELHADCWAGVWANSAYYAGSLQAGDVEEAVRTTQDLGDYEFDRQDRHHGTPAQRSAAFMTGYDSGAPRSCDTFLTSDYS